MKTLKLHESRPQWLQLQPPLPALLCLQHQIVRLQGSMKINLALPWWRWCLIKLLMARWWFRIFSFSPLLGEDFQFDSYFSDWWFKTTDHANKKHIGVFPKDLLIWIMMFDMHLLDAIRYCKVVVFCRGKRLNSSKRKGIGITKLPTPSLKLTAKAPENGWLEVGR